MVVVSRDEPIPVRLSSVVDARNRKRACRLATHTKTVSNVIQEVQKAFDLYNKTDSTEKPLKYAKCKYCEAFDAYAHTTRMNDHLLKCEPRYENFNKHIVGDRVMKQSTIKSNSQQRGLNI